MQTNLDIETRQEISDIRIIFYPELAAAALAAGEAEMYVVWSFMRAISINKNNRDKGNGKFLFNNFKDFTRDVLDVKESRAYTILREGQGKYWSKFGKDKNGNKVSCLIGLEALVDRLEPVCTRCEPFVVRGEVFFQDEEVNVKSMLISMVAARYVKEHPNSIDSIAELTGQSIRTVQRALRECVDLNVVPQYHKLTSHATEQQAKAKLRHMQVENAAMYSIREEGNMFTIYRQLPNYYSLTSPERLPLRKRPKALKARDHINMSGLSPRKFFQENTKKQVEQKHFKNRGIMITESGVAGVWSEHSAVKLAPRTTIVAPKSIVAKWIELKRASVSKRGKLADNRSKTHV